MRKMSDLVYRMSFDKRLENCDKVILERALELGKWLRTYDKDDMTTNLYVASLYCRLGNKKKAEKFISKYLDYEKDHSRIANPRANELKIKIDKMQ